jgi:hypothetical protein
MNTSANRPTAASSGVEGSEETLFKVLANVNPTVVVKPPSVVPVLPSIPQRQ